VASLFVKCVLPNKSDTGSQGSDSNEDDTVKQPLIKIDKKYDNISAKLNDLSDIKKSVEFLSTKYDDLILQNTENKRLITDLTKKVEIICH
jgi:hypothetical protein